MNPGFDMKQYFRVVAPRARLKTSWRGPLGELLFDDLLTSDLVWKLVKPARESDIQISATQPASNKTSTTTLSVGSNQPPSTDPQGVKQNIDGKLQAEGTQAPTRSETRDSTGTLWSLPPEMHLLILSFLDSLDIMSFGLTNRYYTDVAKKALVSYYRSLYGQWAGTNIVCIGARTDPNYYPPGLSLSDEELRALAWEKDQYYDRQGVRLDRRKPFTLSNLMYGAWCEEDPIWLPLTERLRADINRFNSSRLRNIRIDPSLDVIFRQGRFDDIWHYFPEDQEWILRNLTAKQIVRSKTLALLDGLIKGPQIGVIGFGEVILALTCWSSCRAFPPPLDPTNICNGLWAGHCFDIMLLSRHKAETKNEKSDWTDVSDDVRVLMEMLWETENGPNWVEHILGV